MVFRKGGKLTYRKTQKLATIRRKKQNRKKYVRQNQAVGRSVGFPKTLKFHHRYVETFSLTASGTAGIYRMNANGMYDPNYTGTGHQPMYFDQLSAIYNHYTVIGSKITYRITPTAETNVALVYQLHLNDDVTSPDQYMDRIGEFSGTRKNLLIAPKDNRTRTLTMKWSAKKTFGGSVLGNDLLQGSSAANPTENSFYQLNIIPADVSTTVNFYIQAFIEYIVIWDELKDIAQS